MANVQKGNVWRIDTSAQISGAQNIRSIKYIGATSASASVKADDSSGTTVWEESGATTVYNPDVYIQAKNGVYVTIASGAVVYLFLE